MEDNTEIRCSSERLGEDLKEHVDIQNVALLGAPKVGKTRALIEFVADNDSCILIYSSYDREQYTQFQDDFALDDTLLAVDEVPRDTTADIVIFDDFYKVVEECIQRAGTGQHEVSDIVLDLLEREQGVVISTTPYRWNTLLGVPSDEESGTLNSRLRRLKERLLGSPGHRDSATTESDRSDTNAYTEYARTFANGSPAATCRLVSFQDAEIASEKLTECSPDKETLSSPDADAIPHYEADVHFRNDIYEYSTYVPFALLEFDRNIVEEAMREVRASRGTLSRLRDGSNAQLLLDHLTGSIGDSASDSVGDDLPLIGPILRIGIDTTVGGGISVLLHLVGLVQQGKASNHEFVEETFGELARLSSPQMEELERELDLEPLTLEEFRNIWIENPSCRDEFERRLAEYQEQFKQLQADVNVSLSSLTIFDEQSLSDLNEQLSGEFNISSVVETMASHTLGPPRSRLSLATESFFEEARFDEADGWVIVDPSAADTITERVVEQEEPLLILRGPMGSGKTTALRTAASELEWQGYFVVASDLTDIPIAKFVLEHIDRKTVLLVDDFNDVDPRRDRRILEFVREQYCDSIILNCRSEDFDKVDTNLSGALASTGDEEDHELWAGAVERAVEIGGVKKATAREIIDKNFGKIDDDTFDQIWSLCQTDDHANPLFVAAAADAYKQGVNLTEHSNAQELLWQKISPVFQQPAGSYQPKYRNIALLLSYTAAGWSLTTEDLQTLLGSDVNVERTLESASAFLHQADQQWMVKPDSLRILILKNHVLNEKRRPLENKPDEILSAFDERDLRVGLTRSIGVLYQLDHRPKQCISYAEEILKKVDEPDEYIDVFRVLTSRTVPIDPDLIGPERIVSSYLDLMFAHNVLARAHVNELEHSGTDRITDYLDKAAAIATAYPESEDGATFVPNMVGNIVGLLSRRHDASSHSNWVDPLVEHLPRLIEEERCPEPKTPDGNSLFYNDTYANAIKSIVVAHPPTVDAGEQQTLTWLDAVHPHIEQQEVRSSDPDFSLDVYSRAISFLSDEISHDPDSWEVEEQPSSHLFRVWLDRIHRHLHENATRPDGESFSLQKIYPNALGLLISESDPQAISYPVYAISRHVDRVFGIEDDSDPGERNDSGQPNQRLPLAGPSDQGEAERLASISMYYAAGFVELFRDFEPTEEAHARLATLDANIDITASHVSREDNFRSGLYAMAIRLLSNHQSAAEAEDWLAVIDGLIQQLPTSDDDGVLVSPGPISPDDFWQFETYGRTIAQLLNTHGAINAEPWLERFDNLILDSADDANDYAFFVLTYYARVIRNVVLTQNPPGKDAWIDTIDERIKETTDVVVERGTPNRLTLPSINYSTTDSARYSFQLGIYAKGFAWILQRYKNIDHFDRDSSLEWLDSLSQPVQSTIDSMDVDRPEHRSKQFARFYADPVPLLCNSKTPIERDEWWRLLHDHLLDRSDSFDNRALFLQSFYITVLAGLSEIQPPEEPTDWFEKIVNSARADFDVRDLTDFYIAYLDEFDPTPSYPLAWLPWFVSDIIDRCRSESTSAVTSPEESAESVGELTATVVDTVWQTRGLDHSTFDSLVEEIRCLRDDDEEFVGLLIERVADKLEREHDNFIAALEWREEFDINDG